MQHNWLENQNGEREQAEDSHSGTQLTFIEQLLYMKL